MEAIVYKTINGFEWYKVSEDRYEGFNKKEEVFDRVVHREFCVPFWIIEGSKYSQAHDYDKDKLMEIASK